MPTIEIHVDAQVDAMVRRLAKAAGLSRAEWLRRTVEARCQSDEELLASLNRQYADGNDAPLPVSDALLGERWDDAAVDRASLTGCAGNVSAPTMALIDQGLRLVLDLN